MAIQLSHVPASNRAGRIIPPSLHSKLPFVTERIALPLPPSLGDDTRFEMDIYARFMRHLRNVPNHKMEVKILASIKFTADAMDIGDALVAKTLTDLGLRAPRQAFPVSFLEFTDRAAQRSAWDNGTPPASITELHEHWERIGEDRFVNMVTPDDPVGNFFEKR